MKRFVGMRALVSGYAFDRGGRGPHRRRRRFLPLALTSVLAVLLATQLTMMPALAGNTCLVKNSTSGEIGRAHV